MADPPLIILGRLRGNPVREDKAAAQLLLPIFQASGKQADKSFFTG